MKEKTKIKLNDRLQKIPNTVKAAFISCFISGFVAHLFAFTNIIPNPDGISRVYDLQQMTVSGRWFLHYASAWNGYVQAPALIGFFSVLFVAIAASFAVCVLEIKKPVFAAFIGALMIVFPSVSFTFLFMFTASAYCFAIMLAVISVWLTKKYKSGFLAGSVLLACATGTYQAYISVGASLALIALILFVLDKDRKIKDILLLALRFIALLAMGLLLYAVILKIFLFAKDLTLIDYRGISSMGSASWFKDTILKIPSAYRKFLSYYFKVNGFAKYTTLFSVVINIAFLVLGLYSMIMNIILNKRHKAPEAIICLIVLLVFVPLAFNLTVLMGDASPIMRYSLVFSYIIVLALTDRTDKQIPQIALGAASILILIVSMQIGNLAYTAYATEHRAAESFATRLVERIETTPGYRSDMEVVIIGGFPKNVYHNEIEEFELIADPVAASVIPNTKHVYYYLNDWLNVTWKMPDESIMMEVSDSEEFKAMPLYPSDGSVVISGDRVIVRLSEAYTPKAAFEIQYENRR
ncbi:MAG: glucosyltransferase domain-containing protein [Lachnospiraceae bacterium]|nr:glucosyltransferase domain-containing protein [Lachnospiraceae bacterium]